MSWRDYASIVTGILSFVIMILISSLNTTVTEMKNQIFTHLTNHEMHTPRAVLDEAMKNKVSVDQFTLYQVMRDRQMADIKDSLQRVENEITKPNGRR